MQLPHKRNTPQLWLRDAEVSYWVRYDRYDKCDRDAVSVAGDYAGAGSSQRASARGVADSVRQERDDREAVRGVERNQVRDPSRMAVAVPEGVSEQPMVVQPRSLRWTEPTLEGNSRQALGRSVLVAQFRAGEPMEIGYGLSAGLATELLPPPTETEPCYASPAPCTSLRRWRGANRAKGSTGSWHW